MDTIAARHRVTVVDHPLAADLLGRLRDRHTSAPAFRTACRQLARLLVLEATRGLVTAPDQVATLLGHAPVERIAQPVAAVPVLRAGLGLLGAVESLYPHAAVGFLGVERQPGTLEPLSYYRKLPPLAGALTLVLEPMLATGGSASVAIAAVREAGAEDVVVVTVVAATVGIERLHADQPTIRIVTAGVDDRLDERGYIVPGLGDFGDRLFATGHGSGLTPPAGS
ncbi:MAG TPA: uracil phosphoribosyltransferase [Nitriliruptorales bacterium]|nr:uracil phosphoribosyltransferase [Nitriliruptorales bacterium]